MARGADAEPMRVSGSCGRRCSRPAIAVSGCGAKSRSASIPDGADFAPASTAVYVTGDHRPGLGPVAEGRRAPRPLSGPREAARRASSKDLAKDGLTWERDVKPALGDELDLALLDFDDADHNYVFFTKPKDQAKFDQVLIETGRRPAGAPRDRRLDGLRRQRAGARQLRRRHRERRHAGRRDGVQGRDVGPARGRRPSAATSRASRSPS